MSLLEEAKRIAAEFEYTDEDVQKGVAHFIKQMSMQSPVTSPYGLLCLELMIFWQPDEGLEKNGTTMSQIPTYVTAVPNGTEKGLYLAVDLGGTNFRVCSIALHGDTTFSLTQSKVPIPKELMKAKTAKELFSFLAKQIETFLKTHHGEHFEAHIRRRQTVSTPEGYRDEQIFRLGFTFSFPVHQVGINRGTLIRWTKGFDIPDAVGQDVCKLLQVEIDLLRLPVRVAALVNDTVGTLMSRSYTSPGKTGTLLGAIFGTGTNGAYVEKLSKLSKPMEGDYDKSTGEMIVNTEWGSFDNEMTVLPCTPYDAKLDAESPNPGFQMFEKRVSGMFLGEILRIVIVSMLENKDVALFRDENSSHNDYRTTTTIAEDSPLFKHWAVDSSILSIAEADNSTGLRVLRQEIDKSLGVSAASIEDAYAVKEIAAAIGKRAARLSGVAIASIVLQTGRLNKPKTQPPTTGTSTGTEGIKSVPAIGEDLKNLNLGEAAKATVAKLANTAGISAAAIDATAGVDEDDIVDIGVDGSLVEFYPNFEEYMRSAMTVVEGIGEEGQKRVRIGIAKDGSGVGAALIALVAASQEKKTDEFFSDAGYLRTHLQALKEAES
ncbi:MAG: glucokinase [Claussenomyces sp. TS43310]|nr:MAG: glucokinase [Claussenomyces sp. TS43310]